jgi:anti-anti-sigma factor
VSDLASLRTRERAGIVIATVTGEVDVSNSARLRSQIAASVANHARGLVIDLGEVEFFDSSGVHMLYDLAERLAHRQQRFAVVLPPDSPPRRSIELSGSDPADWLHDDQPGALAALGS